MKDDARLRMNVYQEGQRAFIARTPCPYADWRAGTWEKGRAAAQDFYEHTPVVEPDTIPCSLCGTPTRMTGTKRCDRCFELEGRIERDPELARQILDGLGK